MLEDKFQLNCNMRLGVGIALLLLICILSVYSIILSWDIHCLDPDRLITIPKGSSAQSVAALLKKDSCLQNETIFKAALTLTMKNKRIRSGRYNLKGIVTIGQLVDVIHSGSMTTGNHSITWNASDMTSGVYFVRAESADGMSVQKVMLMK